MTTKQLLLVALCFTFGLTINAQDNSIDLNGKELFGDLTARQIGPALMSGRIIDVQGHPTNPRVIYIGTAGGGVWKSNDGGSSYAPIFEDNANSIGSIAVDPSDPDQTIWVGTGEIWTRNSVSVGDGLYKTTDGGSNWTKIGFDKSERISSIQINPNNSNEVYVGVLGALWSDSDERGVYKTTDGGKTWNKVLYSNETTGCADLFMDPKNPNTLYASMWEFRRTPWSFNSGGPNSALYKSTDGGKNWNKIHNDFPEGDLGRIAIGLAPSDPSRVYAVIESKEDKGLYRSDNAGQSWTKTNGDFGLVVRPFYFSRIVIDPKNPDVVVKGGLSGSISRDGGKTFKDLGNMHSDIHDIWFDLNNSDMMHVGTDGGMYRTWDGGSTMDMVDDLPLSQFYQISVDDAKPYNIYGGLQDNGSWYGPSSSPGGIEARDWVRVGVGDGFRVLKHPTKPILYSEMQGADNVWRYEMDRNYTKNVKPLPVEGYADLRFNWNAPMAISAHQPDRFYMGSQFVHKSEDMGNSWTIISPDLTTNDPAKQNQKDSGGLSVDNSGAENHTTIFTIAESPLDEKVIWVGTDDGNVQVTQDGGKNWTNVVANVPNLPANTWVYHIEASVHGKGTAYAVFEGHSTGDMNPYTYKTTDFGKTWTSVISDDVVGFVRNIQEDYVNENLLFLGTEFGLYITVDGGKKWNKFTNNFPATAVHFLDLQKETNDLVAGTHGRGIIIIDDISVLRQITPENVAKDVVFLEGQPGVMKEEGGFGGGSTELQFVGPNPSGAAKITYFLKKRHTFGKMSMQIQDDEGNKIAELSPGKSKGLNFVQWNYNMKPPKVAAGKTMSFGGFTPPRVKAGTYNVVLNKGKDTYKTTIKVENDPNSPITPAERDAQYKTTMELYKMTEDLAYMVYEIDTYIEKAEAVVKTNPKAKKLADKMTSELNELKKTMVITTGDNYVGSAPPELREKLAALYSDIASSYEAPSSAQLANLELLKKRYNATKADLEKAMNKEVAKFNSFLEKNNIEPVTFEDKEKFLSSL